MFEYFREKITYLYKKLIPLMILSSTGVAILKVNCFFHMEPQIHAVSWIGYLGSNKIKVNRIKNDNQGRILIAVADNDEETFVLINLHNANTETEQIKTIYELDQLLSDFCLDSNKKKQYLQGISIYSLIQLWRHQVVNPLLKKIYFKTFANI